MFIAKKAESSNPSLLLKHQLFHCSNQSPLNPPCWQVTPPPQATGPAQHLRISQPHAVLPGSSVRRTVSGGQSEWEGEEKRGEREEEIKRRGSQRPDDIREQPQADPHATTALYPDHTHTLYTRLDPTCLHPPRFLLFQQVVSGLSQTLSAELLFDHTLTRLCTRVHAHRR